MRKPVLIAAALSLTTSAVLADMYQDAGNAKLPDARQNLELGTVKSEGGGTGVVTSFYDDYGRLQHRIASQPEAAEYAIEQAGLAAPGGVGNGQGATRVCTADAFNTGVHCNYIASGRDGKQLFGNGAGALADMLYGGAGGSVQAWPRLVALDRLAARLESHADSWPDIDLELKPQGRGNLKILNGTNTIATFSNPAAGIGSFLFMGPTNGGAGTISAEPNGVQLSGQRILMRATTGNYTVPTSESGYQYHNTGAGASVTLTLPVAVQGLNYCFSVHVAQQLIVKASGTDKIAIAGSNSVAGGQVASNLPFASLCIAVTLPGQWVTRSTADKTQWTVT